MPVNHEVKGTLARLLATEDLVVEHKNVQTAAFNVHTRVLTLPMWEKASNTVYDMLVGHEVGHALYTPDDDWWETCTVPKQFVNVVEDARIEKLMKRRYAGLSKTFYQAYKELNDDDFFQLENDDISSLNLADRSNLYFKVGNFLDLKFTAEEQNIVDIISNAETFADVLVASEILYNYCKKENEEQKVPKIDDEQSSQSNDQSSNQTELNQSNSDNPQQQQEGEDDQEVSDNDDTDKYDKFQSGGDDNLEVKTMETLENSLKDFVKNNAYENYYVELPKLNLDEVIVTNDKIHTECKLFWEKEIYIHNDNKIFDEIDKEYVEFKRSAQKEVNYLVKEFECRKAADNYSRSAISRTGILDCTKLQTYKYNEDLFKKITTIANGKNHGLIFILDWSGSMSNVIIDTIKQLYNLIWFCKKTNIPFDVYAFTNEWSRVEYGQDGKAIMPKPQYEKKEGFLAISQSFSLLNMFTNKVNGKVLDDQLKNIYRTVAAFNRGPCNVSFQYPSKLSLSGTPLNESLICMHQIIPKFQKENKLQKVQCVILTDGEAAPLKMHVEVKRDWEIDSYIGVRSINPNNTFLRDRKTGNVYKIGEYYYNFTDLLIRNLRDNYLDVNFIGMRILENRDAGNFVRKYAGYLDNQYDIIMSRWKKDRSFSIKNSGYHSYFGISSSALNNNIDFEVCDDATKGQIKSAFAKSLSSKKMNKKILGEFVELIV
jgi:hypothetical protein